MFVIAYKIERAYWRKYITPNGGRSDNAAKSDDIGISVLTQGVKHFSWKSSSTVEAKDSQANFFWDSRKRSMLLCFYFSIGFWIGSNLVLFKSGRKYLWKIINHIDEWIDFIVSDSTLLNYCSMRTSQTNHFCFLFPNVSFFTILQFLFQCKKMDFCP